MDIALFEIVFLVLIHLIFKRLDDSWILIALSVTHEQIFSRRIMIRMKIKIPSPLYIISPPVKIMFLWNAKLNSDKG